MPLSYDIDGNAALTFHVRVHLRAHVPIIMLSGVEWEQMHDDLNPEGVIVVPWPGGEDGAEWRGVEGSVSPHDRRLLE